MKILSIHSVVDGKPGNPVDLWRMYRPLEHVKKNTDWQIDYQRTIIKEIAKYRTSEQFTEEELERTVEALKDYDLIYISYWNVTRHVMALLHAVKERYGTNYVIDVDDDIYDVPYHNPIWQKVNVQEVEDYQTIINIAPYVSTTNDHLANKIRQKKQSGEVFVIPNYIDDSYQHDPINNGENIVIGYFGGASHYRDLHRTGIFPALQKIMHENKNVRFECVGQPVDYYLPKARVKVTNPVNGLLWPSKLFPTLNFDVAVAPLQDDGFADSKSNIKWQEATRMGAAFIGSNVGPYKALKKSTALLTPNTEEAWYLSIQTLVDDTKKRQAQLAAAQKELEKWRLEDHWQEYVKVFKEVTNANN